MFWLTQVRSHSMSPTLPDGSVALTRSLGPTTRLRRGDLVIIHSPELGEPMVKRIIGLPGESVVLKEGEVYIDGHRLPEPYARPSVFTDSYRVPSEHYFLLGDNRDVSSDSRTWRNSYVPREYIVGRIVRLRWAWTWPILSDFRRLRSERTLKRSELTVSSPSPAS